jgi:hypothetical protein
MLHSESRVKLVEQASKDSGLSEMQNRKWEVWLTEHTLWHKFQDGDFDAILRRAEAQGLGESEINELTRYIGGD